MSRYLLISSEFPPFFGGIAKYASNLACSIAEEENEVFILTEKRHCAKQPYKQNVFYFYYSKFNSKLLRKLYSLTLLIYLIVRICKREKIEKILVIDPSNSFSMPLIRKITKIKYDLVLHGSELVRYAKRRSTSRLFELSLKNAQTNWCNSSFTRNLLVERYNSIHNHQTVYCGVENRFFSTKRHIERGKQLKKRYGISPDHFVIGTIARIDMRKGQNFVISCLPELITKIPSLLYIVIGKGNGKQSLVDLTISLGVSESVRFTGSVSENELIYHYDLLNIFVMPNQKTKNTIEGFGISFIEAAARGIPSIGCDEGGVPDAISEKSGILISSQNREEFITAVFSIFQYPLNWDQKKIRNFASTFTWKDIARTIIEH